MDDGAWPRRFLAVVFLLVALYCVARLALSIRRRAGDSGEEHGFGRDATASHVLMALGMAAAFSPWDTPVPGTAWAALFALVAAWFGYRLVDSVISLRSEDRTRRIWAWHDTVEPAAMAYMMLAMPPDTGPARATLPGMVTHALSAGPLASLVTLMLLTYFVLFTLWSVSRLVRVPARAAVAGPATAGGPFPAPVRLVLSPKLAVSCQTAIAAGMAYMLLLMR